MPFGSNHNAAGSYSIDNLLSLRYNPVAVLEIEGRLNYLPPLRKNAGGKRASSGFSEQANPRKSFAICTYEKRPC
jgi:hypothetical protein